MVTLADLHAISGTRSQTAVTKATLEAFNKYAPMYDVTTQKRIALALAHISVETGGFRILEENMNYSAKRLREVWPSRFKTDAIAAKYAGNPKALANYVYGQRMGNIGRKDAGWLYRGSGPGQVTGYDNFLRSEKETGIPFTSQPDLMRDPDTGMKATLMLWRKWGMNELADAGKITESRKKWNGGTHGLAEVKAAYDRGMKRSLSVGKSSSVTATPVTPLPEKVTPEDSILKKGSTGPFVVDLQKSLVSLGYSVVVDGKFGPATESAVKSFQEASGLEVDGWAGPRTIEAVGRALSEKTMKPKIREAAETVSEVNEAQVKDETNWFQKIIAFVTGGGGLSTFLYGVDWKVIVAIFLAGLVLAAIVYFFRRRLITAFREINISEITGGKE